MVCRKGGWRGGGLDRYEVGGLDDEGLLLLEHSLSVVTVPGGETEAQRSKVASPNLHLSVSLSPSLPPSTPFLPQNLT